MAQFAAERASVQDAISGAGDPDQARHAALVAHDRQHDAWATTLGAVVSAAALAGGTHLLQSAQDAGADVPDYDPDSDDPDCPDAWAAENQDDIANGVQHHTGRMLVAALAGALLGGAGGAALGVATDDLYDQWTGQTNQGDYAGQIAGDLVVLGWGLGELWGIGQLDSTWQVEKTWNTMGDDRVRPAHEDVDGTTVDAGDTFDVDGEDLAFPGDPAGSDSMTAGCRCWLTWTMTNNVTGATEDTEPENEED
jgi:hypothetical protein